MEARKSVCAPITHRLPTRNCILLGVASQVPTLVEVKNLEACHRPESDDPDFWNVWTNKSKREVNWERIEEEWVGIRSRRPTATKASDSAPRNKENGDGNDE
jgi:hypothetical protein